ncbi:hypothetical protein FACS1894201_09330 [Bacteroidia bacterium]|nr:hypothetical protein FACS1894201_09330 [Bacteroidia bacterium]
MKKLICISAFLWLSAYLYAQNDIFTWNGKIVDKNNESIPNVHVQLNANEKIFLFTSNTEGIVEIMYGNSQNSDSVIISSMGYKTFRTTIEKVANRSIIQLEGSNILLSEVTIRSHVDYITLGNLSPKYGFTSNFPSQKRALFIPNSKKSQENILSVKVYVESSPSSMEATEYMPFRLRLYDGKSFFEDEITTDTLIAAMKSDEQHWVNIDLSSFYYKMPQNGIYVVIEMLPLSFYIDNGYITQKSAELTYRNEKQPRIVPTFMPLGVTKKTLSNKSLQNYFYLPLDVLEHNDSIWQRIKPKDVTHASADKWLTDNKYKLLIQIEVETKK